MWDEFSEYLLETRFLTSAKNNTHPLRIFRYKFRYFKKHLALPFHDKGWTSLTESGPGDGTLTVLPLLKEPLAHILMRSLLDDIPDYQMLGHKVGRSQLLDPVLHEKLANSMVTLPKVYPGDTVWWHCDIIHS